MRRLAWVSLAVALAFGGPARAELASRTEEGKAVHIVVLGDSLGEGLWGSLYRRFLRQRSVKITDLARASTGFNAAYYEHALDALGDRPIDLLIVQTGANDRQRVLGLDGRETAQFGTARWFQLYGQRLDVFLGTMQQRGIPVLWVGLPVMRDAAYDRGMRLINRVHQAHAQRHGAVYLDVAAFTGDADGAYAEHFILPNGRKRRLRHQDGVHSWEFGYDRLAAHVVEVIRMRMPGLLPAP